MKKSKAIRLAGFVGALCASGALLGTSISSTGAWFTDSANGNLTASSGHLKLTGVSNTSVNFANLMPGEDRTQNIPYTVDVSGGGVDIWLVFDKTTAAYGAFTGSNGVNYGGHTSGGMGRYGHFQVGNDGNVAFRSHNLQLANPGPNCADGTVPGADGRGGSDATGSATAECGVPDAIKLVSRRSGETRPLRMAHPLREPQALAVARNMLWIANTNQHEIIAIDLAHGALRRVPVGET